MEIKKRQNKKAIFIFLIPLILSVLVGCNKEAPECNADETKALVVTNGLV